jgi:hypothetical protein
MSYSLNKSGTQLDNIIAYLEGITSGSEEGINISTGAQVKCDAFVTNVLATFPEYKAGQISFDPDSLTNASDTGITGVRVQIGQEVHYLVYNDTVSQIDNGKACYASGVDSGILTVDLADNSSFQTSAQVLGLATHNIGVDELGLVTTFGTVRDFDTTGIGFGLTYLGTNGDLTSTKPLYPAVRTSMGAKLVDGVTDGAFHVSSSNIPRRNASRSYTFTSAAAAAGTHYRAGFYDWATTSVTLTNASLTQVYGTSGLTKAAHVGIVPSAAGTVDTGQVGLQVTGTLDSETGVQVASQTAIITDDITTLSTDTMIECVEKFSGQVTLSLYTVSGTPTTYSVTFNYGYSKYEDFANIDATVTAFDAVWEAGAADTGFDISLLLHTASGWTYAASGFEPGNGAICNRLTDQQIESNLATGESGPYKRVSLNQFVEGSGVEGVLIKIETNSTNTIRSMDMHVTAFSEELS